MTVPKDKNRNECACGRMKRRYAGRCVVCRYGHEYGTPVPAERFWAKVDRREPAECWPWIGSRITGGYGTFNEHYAHRMAYEFANGPIPSGLNILHRCDNPPCCNPAHLYAGTQRDNNLDAMARGRWKKPPDPWATGKRQRKSAVAL